MPQDSWCKPIKGLIDSLYFSVVTITSLGYGDVYPTNSIAKCLVTAESILGVVVIGLFLNAASQQLSIKVSNEEKRKNAIILKNKERKRLISMFDILNVYFDSLMTAIYLITTPIDKRKGGDMKVDLNFKFNDMYDLYNPTLLMKYDINDSPISVYFKKIDDLIPMLLRVMQNIDLEYWPELKELFISFIKNYHNYEFRNSLLGNTTKYLGKQKLTAYFMKAIKEYSGNLEFSPSNGMNQFVSLYYMLHSQVLIKKKYDDLQNRIREEHDSSL